MAIDPLQEEIISMTQAAKCLPSLRNNRPVAPNTVQRWAREGVTVGGQTVRLETTTIAGRTATSREAIKRFLNACHEARTGESPVVQMGPTVQTAPRSEVTERLRKIGVVD